MPVDEAGTKVLVTSFAELESGRIYTLPLTYKEALARVQQSQEDEYGRALLQGLEPDQVRAVRVQGLALTGRT